jgi:hypothetical protein
MFSCAETGKLLLLEIKFFVEISTVFAAGVRT